MKSPDLQGVARESSKRNGFFALLLKRVGQSQVAKGLWLLLNNDVSIYKVLITSFRDFYSLDR